MKRRYDVIGVPDQQTAETLDQEIQKLLLRFQRKHGLANPLIVHVMEGWIGLGHEAFSNESENLYVPPASNRAVKQADSTHSKVSKKD